MMCLRSLSAMVVSGVEVMVQVVVEVSVVLSFMCGE
jgi:hypothetical protein